MPGRFLLETSQNAIGIQARILLCRGFQNGSCYSHHGSNSVTFLRHLYCQRQIKRPPLCISPQQCLWLPPILLPHVLLAPFYAASTYSPLASVFFFSGFYLEWAFRIFWSFSLPSLFFIVILRITSWRTTFNSQSYYICFAWKGFNSHWITSLIHFQSSVCLYNYIDQNDETKHVIRKPSISESKLNEEFDYMHSSVAPYWLAINPS